MLCGITLCLWLKKSQVSFNLTLWTGWSLKYHSWFFFFFIPFVSWCFSRSSLTCQNSSCSPGALSIFHCLCLLLRDCWEQNCECCRDVSLFNLFSDPLKCTRFNLQRQLNYRNKLQTGISAFPFIQKMTGSGRKQVRLMSDFYLAHSSSFGQILSECYCDSDVGLNYCQKLDQTRKSELERITLQRYKPLG